MLARKLLVMAGLAVPLAVLSAGQPPAKTEAPPAKAPQDNFPALNGGELRVEGKDIPTQAEIQRVTRLANSSDPEYTATANDRPVLDKVVRYSLYRLTWEEVQEARDPQRTRTIHDIMNEMVGGQDVITNNRVLPRVEFRLDGDQEREAQRTRQLAFVQLVTPSFLQYGREVLKSQAPIARVNAARVFAKLAEFGQEAVVDDLIRIIRHPQESNAVKLWAFVGLEEILGLVGTPQPRARGLFQAKGGAERQTAAITAVFEWLDANTKVSPDKLAALRPDGQAGLRYVRRAAERALGAGRRPLILDDRQNNKQVGPIADLLIRVVDAEGISPTPDLRERLDASLALMQLDSSRSPSYQADYAAHKIANFLVAFGTETNSGRNTFSWPYESFRLRTALETFPRRAGPAQQYVAGFVAAAQPLILYLDNQGVHPDAVRRMSDWVRDNRPASQQTYKGAEQ